MFRASPIHVEETVNGSKSAAEAAEANDKLEMSEKSEDMAEAIELLHNVTQTNRKSGGFFKWLKPGEKLKFPDGVNVPIELASVAPELFHERPGKFFGMKREVSLLCGT